MAANARSVLVVAGPESSATRILHDALSRHPDVYGADAAVASHEDALDAVWDALRRGRRDRAAEELARHAERPTLLTRRSLPHGPKPGRPAAYLDFPDVEGFVRLCREAGRRAVLLLSTRSPAALLGSWTVRRASTAGSMERSLEQYDAAYRALFDCVLRTGAPFLLISYEALLLDGDDHLLGLQRLLGLREVPARLELAPGRNAPAYRRFSQRGTPLPALAGPPPPVQARPRRGP